MKKILISLLAFTSIHAFAQVGDGLLPSNNDFNQLKLDKVSYGDEASGFIFHDKNVKIPTANDKLIYICKGHHEPLVIYGLLKDAKNKDNVFEPIYVKDGFIASNLKVMNKNNWIFTANGPQVIATNPDSGQLTFILQKKDKSKFYVNTVTYPTAVEASDQSKMIMVQGAFNTHNPGNYSYDENPAQPQYMEPFAASNTRIVAENTTSDGIVVSQAIYNSYSKGIDFRDLSKLDHLTYDFLPYKVNKTINPLSYNYKGNGIIVCGDLNENKNIEKLRKAKGLSFINQY